MHSVLWSLLSEARNPIFAHYGRCPTSIVALHRHHMPWICTRAK